MDRSVFRMGHLISFSRSFSRAVEKAHVGPWWLSRVGMSLLPGISVWNDVLIEADLDLGTEVCVKSPEQR